MMPLAEEELWVSGLRVSVQRVRDECVRDETASGER
jgi:hypothetical protein